LADYRDPSSGEYKVGVLGGDKIKTTTKTIKNAEM